MSWDAVGLYSGAFVLMRFPTPKVVSIRQSGLVAVPFFRRSSII